MTILDEKNVFFWTFTGNELPGSGSILPLFGPGGGVKKFSPLRKFKMVLQYFLNIDESHVRVSDLSRFFFPDDNTHCCEQLPLLLNHPNRKMNKNKVILKVVNPKKKQ